MKNITVTDEQLNKLKVLELQILLEFDRVCRKYEIPYSLAYGTALGAVRHKGFIPWDDDIDLFMSRDAYNRFVKIAGELDEKFFFQSNATDPEYFHLFDKIRMNGTLFKENYLAKYNINHGVYIDIFICDKVPSNKLRKKLHFLHYQLYRVGLMSKYLDTNYRKGKKKIFATVIKVLYLPFSLQFLYRKASSVAKKYNNKPYKELLSLADSISHADCISVDDFDNMPLLEFENYKFPVICSYKEHLADEYGDYMKLPDEKDRHPHHDLLELNI